MLLWGGGLKAFMSVTLYACKSRKLIRSHSRMEFVKKVRACKEQSPLIGTQMIERRWRSPKSWLGTGLKAKDAPHAFNARAKRRGARRRLM